MQIDAKDKLAVGGESDYVIHVMNHGSGAARNVQVIAVVPDQMEVKSKEGPTEATVEKQTLTFAPLAALAGGEEKTYKIHVRAVRAGEVKLVVELKSDELNPPLHEEEPTTIFGEAAAVARNPSGTPRFEKWRLSLFLPFLSALACFHLVQTIVYVVYW